MDLLISNNIVKFSQGNKKKQDMRILFLLLVWNLGNTTLLNAQSNDCLKDFDYLVHKIKVDYPGYHDKVTSENFHELQLLEEGLYTKIIQHPDSCWKCLRRYAGWFKDNHLRVGWIWPAEDAAGLKKNDRKLFKINELKLKELQTMNSTPEGIWHSFRGDIAIVKDSNQESYKGVSISYSQYEKNQIGFTLSGNKDGEYNMVSYPGYNDYYPVEGKASLKLNDRVLELHDDTRLVRKTNSSAFDDALWLSYIPEFPNGSNTYYVSLLISDSTFYIRIPSFMDDLGEKIVRKYWSEITSTPNLIIDIRNNSGGQDEYYQLLADLLYTNPYTSKGVEWYSTKNNIKMYEDAIKNGDIRNGEEGIRWTNSLLNEMKKNIGGFVIHPMIGADTTVKNDTIYNYPKRVGIIINEGNASSAEQFLLTAKESSKVILFGNYNTAGVLDYSNTISENFPSNKYKLTFPMTRSRRLPDNPIDNIGIPPDIYIPYPASKQLFDRLDQWVYFVKNYLELMDKKE
ncbi:MAG: S41 family peptidase [Bacteroidales bacterium]|nr:S41 family peptidase [Bacteroidales bacterium]